MSIIQKTTQRHSKYRYHAAGMYLRPTPISYETKNKTTFIQTTAVRRENAYTYYIVILFYRLSTISGPRPGSVVLTSQKRASVKWAGYVISAYTLHGCAPCVNVPVYVMYTRLTKPSKVKTVYNSDVYVVIYRI